MQPESSDGLASVGTILPKEGAALLPGGSFRFYGVLFLPIGQALKGSNDGHRICAFQPSLPKVIRPGNWTNISPPSPGIAFWTQISSPQV
jgi:hypothetical protein